MHTEVEFGQRLEWDAARQAIIEHPIRTAICCKVNLGILDGMNENAEQMKNSLRLLVRSLQMMALVLMIALYHMAMLALYPIMRIRRVYVIRRALIEGKLSAPEEQEE